MAATYQLGYRLGMIVSGAGALYIAASSGWRIAYLAMAALVFVGVITVLVIQEPTPPRDEAADEREKKLANSLSSGLGGQGHALIHWFSAAVISPFVDFFSRLGRVGVAILVFIAVYKLSDVVLGIIANVFYIDFGLHPFPNRQRDESLRCRHDHDRGGRRRHVGITLRDYAARSRGGRLDRRHEPVIRLACRRRCGPCVSNSHN